MKPGFQTPIPQKKERKEKENKERNCSRTL
jgi:hypothetical protein